MEGEKKKRRKRSSFPVFLQPRFSLKILAFHYSNTFSNFIKVISLQYFCIKMHPDQANKMKHLKVLPVENQCLNFNFKLIS